MELRASRRPSRRRARGEPGARDADPDRRRAAARRRPRARSGRLRDDAFAGRAGRAGRARDDARDGTRARERGRRDDDARDVRGDADVARKRERRREGRRAEARDDARETVARGGGVRVLGARDRDVRNG